ncbi:MAG: uroporphyrinogen decarboxylase family protein [Methylacidiphilales bacterium]|nr:uroporphyrinogen decarboxylase family protein [Candidatus Methylacidiphilales bacterium]
MSATQLAPDTTPDRLAGFDFKRHNEEVRKIWAALDSRRPPHRIPIILGTNTRYCMFTQAANPSRLDFQQYSEDPDTMFDAQLRFQRWIRFNLLQDFELGLPEKWTLGPDFQNYYESGWLGCKVHYFPDQVPDTLPDFVDAPERIMEKGIPDPFGGLMARGLEYWEHFKARAKKETFLDRPIEIGVPFLGTDGPMTGACNLFGAGFVCETMADDPDRLCKLLDFITEAIIRRITAWRKLGGLPIPYDNCGLNDDSIALISTPMYREHILPHHRRYFDALATAKPRGMHLCGDATRHFRTLRDELNVQGFDTGFPVDFGTLRRELGPNVRIQGGPHVEFLMRAKPPEVREEVRRILQSGILEGGQFVLREGNNLPPGTPLENTEAMYHAGREFGVLAG